MAVPKKRHSHSRTRNRRAHDALTTAKARLNNIVKCSKCGEPRLSHRKCRCEI